MSDQDAESSPGLNAKEEVEANEGNENISILSIIEQDIISDNESVDDEVKSVLSSTDSDISSQRSWTSQDAQIEWEESINQLVLLANLVILPLAGKYFGRKFAYFGMDLHVFFFFFLIAFSIYFKIICFVSNSLVYGEYVNWPYSTTLGYRKSILEAIGLT